MFAERLIHARKAAGLSMSALAAEVGVSANAIKKYEHGEAMPASGNLLKLAKALGEDYIGEPKTAELIGMSLASFHKERKLGVTDAATDQ